MEKTKKQIPIDNTNIKGITDFISTEFSCNFNDKTNEILNSFFSMIIYEKIGMVNFLTMDEAMLLSDIMYSQKYNSQISPKTFLLEHIKNVFLLGIINKNYNIDQEIFLDKIKKISEFQCYILIILACQCNAKKNVDKDFTELIKQTFLING